MIKDYQITFDDFINNNGFSAKYFFSHMLFFVKNKPDWLNVSLFRYKLVLQFNNKIFTLRPHYNGKSNKFVSVLDGRHELLVIKHLVTPQHMFHIVLTLFK